MGREEDCGISLELGLPGGRKAGALSQGWDVMWGEGSRRWAQEEAQIRVTGGRVPQTHFSPSGVCVGGGVPCRKQDLPTNCANTSNPVAPNEWGADFPGAQLAMPGDVFGCQNWGWINILVTY